MSAQDRRVELVAAAIRVLKRDGVAAATTRAIVAEAGMTLGVFHYCFESREQVLRQVSRQLVDEAVTAARETFTHEHDLRTAIVTSLDTFWRGVEARPGEELVGYELAQYAMRQNGLADLARYQYAHYLEVYEEFLHIAAETARVEWTIPVPVLARYVNATLDGLAFCWLADRDSEASRAVLDVLADYLVGCARSVGQASRPGSTDA